MTRVDILAAAQKCVCGDRDNQYGNPENSFKTIAEFWTSYVKARCVSPGAVVDISPVDVAAMMALLKIARITSAEPKADNWIDLAGYAACGGELQNI